MTTCRYLHRKRERFHFRRRLPGFYTAIGPICASLGTTDPTLAHIWIGNLTQEFERMFDSSLSLASAHAGRTRPALIRALPGALDLRATSTDPTGTDDRPLWC